MQTFFPIFSEKSQKFFIFVNFEAIFCKHKQYAHQKHWADYRSAGA